MYSEPFLSCRDLQALVYSRSIDISPGRLSFLVAPLAPHAPACIELPSPQDHLIILSPDLEYFMQVSGGVEEHMAADRLHRAMATVFETCSSVLEGWKNAGLTRTNSKHRTSMDRSPCLELYPDEHRIESDSWHIPASVDTSAMASISVPMALALVTWRCWPSTAASSGLRATCRLHAAATTAINSALNDWKR
jgi:hypothetical protein